MKELSIEEKAKRYDEAIERARNHCDRDGLTLEQYETIDIIFPELKENEDERIKKRLIDYIKINLAGYVDCNRYVTWLEKQGEQKPTAWSKEDEKFFKTAIWHISYSVSNGKNTDEHCDTTDWLKGVKERLESLRPQKQWKPSDEQIMYLSEAIDVVTNAEKFSIATALKVLLKQLIKEL